MHFAFHSGENLVFCMKPILHSMKGNKHFIYLFFFQENTFAVSNFFSIDVKISSKQTYFQDFLKSKNSP